MLNPDSTNIPADELERFSKHLFRYQLDSTIIEEGQDNNAIYLLREGTIAVEKKIGNKSTRISTIQAVNFFGEMAMIVGAKRTATIKVISPLAIVYKFQFLDLKVIYTNPAWSELLIARLCNDLVETNNRAASLENENQRLVENHTKFVNQSGLLFAALLSLEKDIAADVVMNTKAWKLLDGMRELTENHLKTNVPDVFSLINVDNRAALNKLSFEQDFPDILKSLI